MRFITCLAATAVLAPAMLLCQVLPTASVRGTVTDPSGASIPAASVRLVNTGTQISKLIETDTQGRYLFNLLPPGTYSLHVSASGFASYNQTGIILNVNAPASVNVHLQLKSASQEVTVSANAGMVDTESGTIHQVVNEQYLENLPLNGRNAADLVYMAPGTVPGKGEDTGSYATTGNSIAISVNGTYGDQVSYWLDGAPHNDPITNVNAIFPDPDALAEFSVQTNNFDARYGGSGGAIVNIVTKSGTNHIHGSLFEYVRNGDLNARNFFAAQHDQLKRNQFGGTIGGPILKNKLFYFLSYQGTTINNVSFGNTAFVPTAAERQGDFSDLKAITNPATGNKFSGNAIPPAAISPLSAAILAKVPASSNPSGELLYSRPSNTQTHQGLAKVDYTIGRHQISVSGFFVNYTDPGWDANGTLLNYHLGQVQTTTEGKISDTFSISPRMVNSFVVDGLVLNSNQTRTAPFSVFDFGNVGVAKPAPEFLETGINVTGYSGWGSGSPAPPGKWLREDLQASELLIYTVGSHTFSVGAEINPYVRFDSRTGYREEPIYHFNGSFTGNGLADFLLGDASSFQQSAGKVKFTRGGQYAVFAQDEWKVRDNLTLSLGLRWEPFLPYTDPVAEQVGGYISGAHSKRFPKAPPGLVFAGDPGFPDGGMHHNLGNFAPRIGFSYALTSGPHTTVLRGGAGIFFEQPFMKLYNNFVENAPFSPSVNLFGVRFSDPYGSAGVVNPFPPFAPVNPGPATAFSLPVTFNFFNPNWRLGHIEAANFTIQRQLTTNLMASVSYVGTRGVHLQYFEERNPAIYGLGATASNTDQRRPLYPYFASLIEMTNGGVSGYNAVQVSLKKRLSHGITFVANYTRSKSLDNQSHDQQFTLSSPDPFDRSFNYGLSDFDTPNNFTLNALWQLPKLQAGNPVLRALASGWGFTGILTWRSGTLFSIVSGQDRSLSGVGADRADLVGNPYLPDRSTAQTIQEYFNTSAFALNALGTFGSAPRNLLRNPVYFDLDMGIQRNFSLGESRKLQFRAEFFNLPNNVHFSQPGDNVSSASTFGRITSAGDPRIIQLVGRFVF
ncbi:MAG: carboxypeptidase regulatory-like domain-containing protein [Terriglobia bacterium]